MILEERLVSRKVTIKELAARLGVSVPTLRKYGECGLLGVDSVSGRTNLFDEAAAVARVEEINRLKSRGYSLALIREKLDERPAGFRRLDLGLDGPTFSPGRHVLLVVQDMDAYLQFARKFIVNGLRASQALLVAAPPAEREVIEALVQSEGFRLGDLRRSRQLTFSWPEEPEEFDGKRLVEAFDLLLHQLTEAGWQAMRFLGHPSVDPTHLDEEAVHAYEERVSVWARKLPVIAVCPWIGPVGSAKTLMQMQRNHEDVVIGDSVFVRA